MKLFLICFSIICLASQNIVQIHSGGTDGDGGHYDHSAGEYHYHHGYPAHQHPNGECPYDEEDFDCGREDCDIVGQHGHIDKPKTTTTSRTQKQENNSASTNSSNNETEFADLPLPIQILFVCICIVFLPPIIYLCFDKIKNFFRNK